MGPLKKALTKKQLATWEGKFASHLAALMEERGLTSRELAKLSGLNDPAIRKWLRAESLPEIKSLKALARALDTQDHPFPDYRLALPPE